ncbi:ROK family transcriptional regulator [Halocella sp. SP3-1]|uniref:ROK family transcriptional regulator n=1 Tax=Halocella sp. SP3-1 TaxID=2382161 RepID=UPI000F7DE71B|nr:ROK family transcriptional regulator [Halocella sp. SP3-1]
MNYLSGNLELMHELNTKQILRVIRQFNPISRSEIVEKTNLTAATVSRIVSKLIEFNLVTETGYGESSGGRKPILLELNPGAVLTVGIDLEIDEIKGLIIDLNGRVLLEDNLSIKGEREQDHIINRVIEIIKKLLSKKDYLSRVTGIGIGMHGLVDYARGISIFPPAFGWRDIPVADMIKKEFDLPVIIENNVRALTLAENWFGMAKDLNNFICLKVGSGIGSGIFTDGKLYRGASNSAGEIGHTMVDEDGPLCSCGNYGCLESMASTPAIVKRTVKALKQGADSKINSMVNNLKEINEETVFLAAKQGDQLAGQVLQDTGRYLGIGIANLINILNPEVVIIGGDIVLAGDIILESMRSTVHNRALSYPAEHVKIINSRMGKEGVAIGAAALILESVFNIGHNINVDIGL